MLECCLQDYHGSFGSGGDKVPKMASVVGILGHLAGQHGRIIRAALVDMFQVRKLSEMRQEMSKSAGSCFH